MENVALPYGYMKQPNLWVVLAPQNLVLCPVSVIVAYISIRLATSTFTAAFQWTHISQNMLQMLFKFRFSFHPNLQYPPMQKSESPDASCNTENARNMLRCLSTHFNSLSLPHTEKCKHFTFVKKVLKTQSLPKTSPPCGGCGQTPLLQTMEKVTVSPDFPQEPAHVWIYKVSFPFLHLGWGSRSVSMRCSAGKWAPRLWPGWMASHGARLEAGQSPWISTWIQG